MKGQEIGSSLARRINDSRRESRRSERDTSMLFSVTAKMVDRNRRIPLRGGRYFKAPRLEQAAYQAWTDYLDEEVGVNGSTKHFNTEGI